MQPLILSWAPPVYRKCPCIWRRICCQDVFQRTVYPSCWDHLGPLDSRAFTHPPRLRLSKLGFFFLCFTPAESGAAMLGNEEPILELEDDSSVHFVLLRKLRDSKKIPCESDVGKSSSKDVLPTFTIQPTGNYWSKVPMQKIGNCANARLAAVVATGPGSVDLKPRPPPGSRSMAAAVRWVRDPWQPPHAGFGGPHTMDFAGNSGPQAMAAAREGGCVAMAAAGIIDRTGRRKGVDVGAKTFSVCGAHIILYKLLVFHLLPIRIADCGDSPHEYQ
ncbi:hypothetical protein EJB05_00236, partial [Eragrostis curvula]